VDDAREPSCEHAHNTGYAVNRNLGAEMHHPRSWRRDAPAANLQSPDPAWKRLV
jgi:hypothetical protein